MNSNLPSGYTDDFDDEPLQDDEEVEYHAEIMEMLNVSIPHIMASK